MATHIKTIKDSGGNTILPRTVGNAVVVQGEQKTLDSKLSEIDTELSQKVESVNGLLPDSSGNVVLSETGIQIDDSSVSATKTWSSEKINSEMVDRQNGQWIFPALINNWQNYGHPSLSCSYMKDALGFVHLRGTVRGGSLGTIVFVLPVGYRPAGGDWYVQLASSQYAQGFVSQNGAVAVSRGGTDWVSFDGVVFLAEQ